MVTCAVALVAYGLVVALCWFCFSHVEVTGSSAPVITVMMIREERRPVREPAPTPIAFHLVAPQVELPVIGSPAIELPADVVRTSTPSAAPMVPAATQSSGTETLTGELELQCPQREPPHYPALSRRKHEQGEVRMRVEIDEEGRIDSVTIVASSGSPRLDEAAREAVAAWRCQPAERDGRVVRAVAFQTMAFVLARH